MWKTLNEVRIPDILAFVEGASGDGQAVHVGTDSLQCGRTTRFVTVEVILTPAKGGRVAYRRESVPRIGSLRERLLTEVWKSADHVVRGRARPALFEGGRSRVVGGARRGPVRTA